MLTDTNYGKGHSPTCHCASDVINMEKGRAGRGIAMATYNLTSNCSVIFVLSLCLLYIKPFMNHQIPVLNQYVTYLAAGTAGNCCQEPG